MQDNSPYPGRQADAKARFWAIALVTLIFAFWGDVPAQSAGIGQNINEGKLVFVQVVGNEASAPVCVMERIIGKNVPVFDVPSPKQRYFAVERPLNQREGDLCCELGDWVTCLYDAWRNIWGGFS